jgi:hypothetical protein
MAMIARATSALPGSSGSDGRLRAYWRQYLEAFKALLECFETDQSPYGLDHEPWEQAAERLQSIVKAIQQEEAGTPFGTGVKLVVQEFLGTDRNGDPDHENAVRAALADIDRVTGAGFGQFFSQMLAAFDGDVCHDEGLQIGQRGKA